MATMPCFRRTSGTLNASARRALAASCPHVVAVTTCSVRSRPKPSDSRLSVRHQHRLRSPLSSFTTLGVPARLSDVLARQGIDTPTPIQAATLPDSLAGRDVLGRGRTGSGKTYAFLLPLVARLVRRPPAATRRAPRALILAPTRELVGQIDAALAPLAAAAGLTTRTVFGGVGQHPQVTALRRGVDIVVACPGRLEDLIGQGHCTPRRRRDHRPRRGRPHGRPRLPARRTPAPRPHAEGRPAAALLGHARQGDRRPGPPVPDRPGDPPGRLRAVAGRRR